MSTASGNPAEPGEIVDVTSVPPTLFAHVDSVTGATTIPSTQRVVPPTSLTVSPDLDRALCVAVDSSTPVGETPMVEDADVHELTEFERKLLAFERQWWKFPGAKEAAIRSHFGITANRYYQALNALVETPAALAYDPMLVRRVRKRRAERRRAQSARQLGIRL